MSDFRRAPEDTSNSRELLRRVQAGDSTAANRLLARYLPVLYRWAHGRMPRWARGILDTADVVHDAALQTLRHLPTFVPTGDGALLGYLRRSLANRIRDVFRQAAHRRPAVACDESLADPADSPLKITIDGQNRARYLRALKRLRPADRMAIVARLELGYSYEQIALVLHKPSTQSARLAVRRALLRLARHVEHG